MNQMLEDYVVEARALREQVGILARIAKILWDTTDIRELSVQQIVNTEPLPVAIKDDTVYLGAEIIELKDVNVEPA